MIHRFKSAAIGMTSVMLTLGPVHAASAQWTKINTQQTSSVSLSFGNEVAYSDKSHVYLQVWGHPQVRARFANADGTPLFGEFVVAAQSASDAYVHVSASNGSADDVFLVTFSSELGGLRVYGRLVRYTSAGPEMSPVFQLQTSPAPSVRQAAGGIAYDGSRRRFLTTWEDYRHGAPQIYGRFVSSNSFSTASAPSMSPAEQNLSATPYGQGTPNISFDPEQNRYLVVFRGNAPDSPVVFGSWGRLLDANGLLVDVNGDGAATAADIITLSRGGEPAEQFAVYLPVGNSYLTMWAEVGGPAGGRDLHGKIISASGQPLTGVLTLFATAGNEGMATGAYNPVANKTLVVFARDTTKLIEGLELTATGVPVVSFGMGSVSPTNRALESQFPTVAAAESGRFGFGYLNDYSASFLEVYHSTSTPGGGTTPPPPPPPPPPPAPPALPLGSGISLTTGSAKLLWQHTDGWLSSWTLSGTTLTTAAPLNPMRAGDPKWRAATTGDLNNDGQRDILWQHEDGWVAVWLMNGINLLSARLLTPDRVTDPDWRIVAVGDLNKDGLTDIVWHHRTQGYVATWLMNGTVAVTMQLLTPNRVGDTNWRIVGTADLNHDGWTDIVWQHQTSGLITSWLMYGATFASAGIFNINKSDDPSWKVRALLDADGDGNADFVWQHATKNLVAVTSLDGLNVVASAWLEPQTVGAGWLLIAAR